LLIGANEAVDKSRLIPVNCEGETVGFLGMTEPCSRVEDEELLFFKGQNRTFLMIALGMVLVAVLVAVWTAYYLEGPIKTLTRGTRDLASGLFKTRIPVKSNDELGRLSQDFNTLAETLEGNEQDRKKWVEDIAHELRTPLTLLRGELEAVEDGVRELNEDTLKRLKGDIEHLIVLVNDLNELSRRTKGRCPIKKNPRILWRW
jgi:two-component system sensor histidine kinase BaeS